MCMTGIVSIKLAAVRHHALRHCVIGVNSQSAATVDDNTIKIVVCTILNINKRNNRMGFETVGEKTVTKNPDAVSCQSRLLLGSETVTTWHIFN